eukprot:8206581-Lingulodinium_polyedra.AAC.1
MLPNLVNPVGLKRNRRTAADTRQKPSRNPAATNNNICVQTYMTHEFMGRAHPTALDSSA